MPKNLPGPEPYLITFDQIGNGASGVLTSTQQEADLPFAVKRVFWVKDTPAARIRGNHANRITEEIMIAVSGSVTVETVSVSGQKVRFELNNASLGLYIPTYCWLTIAFSADAILVCLASTDFDEADYIQEFATFQRYQKL